MEDERTPRTPRTPPHLHADACRDACGPRPLFIRHTECDAAQGGLCPHGLLLCGDCHGNRTSPTPLADTCWQCDAPLGTTERCLTCAAKRAEDAARVKP